MRIGPREIGPGRPPYVIAEIGVNHDGCADRALSLVDVAAEAGADAVKVQLFETDRLMSRAAKLAAYQRDAGETDPIEMLRRLELSLDDLARVAGRARERGLHAIATVFSVELVEPAESIGWDAYKTASPDIVNHPLLEAIGGTGKPMIVSTGAADLEEVREAFGRVLEPARGRVAALQCVSSYPTPRDRAAIGGMLALGDALGPDVPVGYSDHTTEHDTGALAVRVGASILEKHLTHDRGARGPDHAASLDGAWFSAYVRLARAAGRVPPDRVDLGADAAYGTREKRVLDEEREVRRVSRQSLVVARDVPAGRALTEGDLTTKRPGDGIPPARRADMVGRTTVRALEADTLLTLQDLR
jgi:N,N'-diacetyllegionaminate synthase